MTKIAEALKRVQVRPDPAQDEAVIQEIDRSGGADIVTVVYNPELVDAVALEGYKIRAAIVSSLEGLARYNRQVKRKHGAYDSDELVFAQGYERALTELEELIHLAPRPETDSPPAPPPADPSSATETEPPHEGGEDGHPDAELEPAPDPGDTDRPGAEGGD